MEENELLGNIHLLHTTPMGAERIRRNLKTEEDAVRCCRDKILSPEAKISRKGKNWYVEFDGGVITVNASSYTIITAHLGGKSGGNMKNE